MTTILPTLNRFCVILIFSLFSLNGNAQSPTNVTTNIALTAPTETDFAPSAFFSSTTQLVAVFNTARRAEETQLGLPANGLGTLTLPVNYATFSPNDRALYLINQERIARAGVTYPGTTAVLGLPMEATESALIKQTGMFTSFQIPVPTGGLRWWLRGRMNSACNWSIRQGSNCRFERWQRPLPQPLYRVRC